MMAVGVRARAGKRPERDQPGRGLPEPAGVQAEGAQVLLEAGVRPGTPGGAGVFGGGGDGPGAHPSRRRTGSVPGKPVAPAMRALVMPARRRGTARIGPPASGL